MKPASSTPLAFSGLRIKRGNEGSVTLDQEKYILSLKKQDDNCMYETFRSYRHKLAWIAFRRPDVMATSNIFSQVTTDKIERKHIKQVNKVISYLHETKKSKLIYEPLDTSLTKLVFFRRFTRKKCVWHVTVGIYDLLN